MMRKLLTVLVTALFSMNLQAQVLLADTAFTTGVGYHGAQSSGLFKPQGKIMGVDMHSPSQNVLSDDFDVPAGQSWIIDTVILYGYEGSNLSIISPFTTAYLQVTKDSVKGTTVFGDHGTNRLVKTGWTGIYRVDTNYGGATKDTSRPLMYIKLLVYPGLYLNPGHYCMIWHANGTVASGKHTYCPPKVLPNYTNPTGQNGKFGHATSNIWHDATDSTVSGVEKIGFNFILIGNIAAPSSIQSVGRIDVGLRIAPNPASRQCIVSFTLSKEESISVGIYDAAGRLVRNVISGKYSSGDHELKVDLNVLSSGTYFCIVQTSEGRQSKTMQVLQ